MSLRSLLASTLRPTAAGCLGVVADAGHATAAAVTRAPGAAPRLTALQAASGAPALATLANWQRRRGLRHARTNLLLDGDDYQILPMDMPEVAPDELIDAMRWRVKEMIDFAPEEASLGCLLVPCASESSRSRLALVVVSRHATITRWMQRSREARLDLHSIDVPELALRNLALLAAGDGACALLHVGLARSTLVVVWKGELCSVRRFELHIGQLLDAGRDAFEALVERLGQDVQRSSDAFERQFHAAALGRLWITDEQAGLALAEPLARQVTLQVRPMKLRDWIAIDDTTALVNAAEGIDFIPAIGAALREEVVA
jgi:MSHA biogenesis protein MshI